MIKKFNPAEIADFARFYGFHYDNLDTRALVREVGVDMRRGLSGVSSYMPMIPSYLKPVSHCPPEKEVIALDAGGTNLRVARVRFDSDGKPIVIDAKKYPMPGTQGRLTDTEFFDALAAVTAPFLENGTEPSGLGFCFSYAMTMTEDGDGIPTMFSKELDIPDVVGKAVGAGLRDALKRRGLKAPNRIVLLNDTVATLLTGITSIPQRYPSNFDAEKKPLLDRYGIPSGPVVGFILGTGFNTAYPEISIPKIGFTAKSALDAQVVVTESGNFLNRYQGQLDKEFDAGTKNPGGYTTEKACSGAYLGSLTLHIFKQAIKDKLVSFEKSGELLAMPALQTKDLNDFLQNPLAMSGTVGSLFANNEASALSSLFYISQIITERAAILSAAVVAGTIIHMEAGYDPASPARVAVEGTTYVMFGQLRRSLESHLHCMLNADKPRSCIVDNVEQASLIGAAVAALS
ncbi:MAG: hexokinase [Termitinemataceae bacterium]|nr:MAG: hexokinase [Termitinemataceae bacterium]